MWSRDVIGHFLVTASDSMTSSLKTRDYPLTWDLPTTPYPMSGGGRAGSGVCGEAAICACPVGHFLTTPAG